MIRGTGSIKSGTPSLHLSVIEIADHDGLTVTVVVTDIAPEVAVIVTF